MDELTFRAAYTAFSVALICMLLFLLLRRLNRRCLRPVLYGFFFGIGCWVLLGAGILAFLFGGILTGYLLSREVSGWGVHLRAGGLAGVLLTLNPLFIPAGHDIFTHSLEEIIGVIAKKVGRPVGHGEFLLSLCGTTLLWAVLIVVVVGLGAVLGGWLRKALKPAKPKVTTVAG